jgi:hypothetical protein
MPMAAKTRAILRAGVLLSAGLAGCADTDESETGDRDTDTGDRDTRDRDRDTGDRDTDTGERDQNRTGAEGEEFNRTFRDTIDEENYMRNWTVPANSSGANVTIEANLNGTAVDDFEATLFTPDGEEVCTVEHSGETGDTGDTVGMDDGNGCEEQLENTGQHQLTVWGNATAGEADYWINVTVSTGSQTDGGQQSTGGDGGGIYNTPATSVTRG